MKKDIVINNLNAYIKEKGIKQNWIADMLDVNKMTISNILNFKTKKVDLDELENIANVLDLTIEELSHEDFHIKEDIFNDIKNKKPAIAFCADLENVENNEDLNALFEIINIIDTVKTANENMKALDY